MAAKIPSLPTIPLGLRALSPINLHPSIATGARVRNSSYSLFPFPPGSGLGYSEPQSPPSPSPQHFRSLGNLPLSPWRRGEGGVEQLPVAQKPRQRRVLGAGVLGAGAVLVRTAPPPQGLAPPRLEPSTSPCNGHSQRGAKPRGAPRPQQARGNGANLKGSARGQSRPRSRPGGASARRGEIPGAARGCGAGQPKEGARDWGARSPQTLPSPAAVTTIQPGQRPSGSQHHIGVSIQREKAPEEEAAGEGAAKANRSAIPIGPPSLVTRVYHLFAFGLYQRTYSKGKSLNISPSALVTLSPASISQLTSCYIEHWA
ncbi:uncharacterized protein LOC116422752 [Sarcophilus harrisii]|uniref:uncharacterized protein LOC116422752 n=1 Tax=Sarcophilus harrisii TaxID=9305 RepID=UPI001301CEC9|nr:uncharacterized protein LOC116422752 [Sarcophilus harrisii]